MRLAVLVPSWKRAESLSRCIDALEAQERLPDQLVLSLRAEDEDSRHLVAERTSGFPITVATPERPGLLAALNAGFDAVDADVVALTDDDTVARPDWLARIEAHFAADPRLGALGGRDRIVAEATDNASADLVVGRILWFGRIVGNHHLGAGPARDADIVKGANMSFRMAALGDRRIDSALRGHGAEHHTEGDLSLGVKSDGWRVVYDPAVLVDHYEEIRHGGKREQQMSAGERRDSIHNQTYTYLKHLPPGRRLVAFLYGILVGTRENPGLLLSLERLLPGRGSAPAGSFATSLRARGEALVSWRRWKRSAGR